MIDSTNLEILTELREKAGLTQSEAAQRCGLKTQTGRVSVSKWESGAMRPRASRRNLFIGYLWDDLQLRENPELFRNVWNLLVEKWAWAPLNRGECEEWGLPYSVDEDAALTLSQQVSTGQLKKLFEVIGQIGNFDGVNLDIRIDVQLR